MAVTQADFRAAHGQFLSLAPVATDRGHITAIAVNIEGIVGGHNARRRQWRATYRVLASVRNLESELPAAWIASPPDGDIEHVNIWNARYVCPLTGTMLPDICWGTSDSQWEAIDPSQRKLGNFLEMTRQILAHANLDSAAR
jgi:hypothetical protein